MINKEIGFKISYNAIMNLIDAYADVKAFCLDTEEEYANEEEYWALEDSPNYNYYRGKAEMAENWLRVCGVSPESNIVQNRIKEYSQYGLTN
jgi:hypothetical protein